MPKTRLYALTEAGKERIARAQAEKHLNNDALIDEAYLSETTFYKMLRLEPVSKQMIVKVCEALDIKDMQADVHYRLVSSETSAFRASNPESDSDPPDFGKPSAEDSAEETERNSPLPYELHCFQGRAQELQTLRERFLEGERKQAVSGLGGVGKTQIALKYVLEFEDKYKRVFWIHAETEESIRSGYADVARRLGLVKGAAQEQEQAVAAALRWLDANSDWLLVMDNADTPPLLRSYLPSHPRGHVLLTTRAHSLAEAGASATLKLGTLSEAESLTFLLQRCGRREASADERGKAAELAQELGCLPLALAHAAAYIAFRETTFAHYLELYQKQKLALLDAPGVPMNDARSTPLRATWEINFKALENHRGTGQAGAYAPRLLEFCAFLGADDIPCELVLPGAKRYCPPLYALIAGSHGDAEKREFCGVEDEAVYHDLLQPLIQYSLVTKSLESPPRFSIHRLLQTVIADRLGDARQASLERAVQAVDSAFPVPEPENWRLCERLQPHALAIGATIRQEGLATREAGRLLYRIGEWLSLQGRYDLARAHAQAALSIRRRFASACPLDLAASLHSLANLRQHQQQFDEAEALYEQALEIIRREDPPNNREILHVLNDKAMLYNSQQMWEQAETAYADLLETAKDVFGGHARLAVFHHNMGWPCYGQGRYEEAARWYQSALNIDPQMADSWHDLAQTYRKLGREEAEACYFEALKIQQQAHPGGHPRTATTLYNIAELYKQTNRHIQAEAYYLKARDMDIKVFGRIHPDVVFDLKALAELYRLMGRQEDANEMQKQADVIAQQLAADDPPANED